MSVTRSSEPTVQHREGADLDALVEQIAAEHPAPVRFLDIDRVRRGGVMGFFAKEQYALSYQVAEDLDQDTETVPPLTAGRHAEAAIQPVDLEALLGSADSRDIGPHRPAPGPVSPTASTEPTGPADERFADLLLRLAAEHTPEPPTSGAGVRPTAGRHLVEPVVFEPLQSARVSRHRAPAEVTAPVLEPVLEPVVASLPRSAAEPPATTVSDLMVDGHASADSAGIAAVAAAAAPIHPVVGNLAAHVPPPSGLAALGVPAGWHAAGADTARAAEIVAAVLALPPAPSLPTAAGAVIVLLSDMSGPRDAALRHLSAVAPGGTHSVADRDGAVRATADLRAADAPGVLVVRPRRGSTLPATVAALQPDFTVLEIEATGKTSDHRRRVDAAVAAGLRIDALAVVRASETTSPATVWELSIPILSVDGRTSDVGAWAGLLLSADRD